MGEFVFRQDSRLGPETLFLKQSEIVIVNGATPRGGRSIRLGNLSPNYEDDETRFSSAYLVPLILALICAAVSWKFYIDDSDSTGFVIFAGMGFMAVIFLFMMDFSPVDTARFYDRRGNVMLEVYRPKKMAHTYDEFVSELSRRIKAAQL